MAKVELKPAREKRNYIPEKILLRFKETISTWLVYCRLQVLINGIIKKIVGGGVRLLVLCYHGIEADQVKNFEWQIDYMLGKGYTFVSGPEVIKMVSGEFVDSKIGKYACLTFDDCYSNIYSNVRPVLLRKGIQAILFAISSKMGKIPDWDGGDAYGRIMEWEELKEMSNSFEIGSHTKNHQKLGQLCSALISEEIRESKKELEKVLNKNISTFAYPNGSYNEDVVENLKNNGFKAAFTIEQHTNYSLKEKFQIGRYVISPCNLKDFRMKVAGGYDWAYYLEKMMKKMMALIAISFF